MVEYVSDEEVVEVYGTLVIFTDKLGREYRGEIVEELSDGFLVDLV